MLYEENTHICYQRKIHKPEGFFYALSALKRNLCGYFLCFITRISEFLSNLVRPLNVEGFPRFFRAYACDIDEWHWALNCMWG